MKEQRTYVQGELYNEIISFKKKNDLKGYSLLEVIMIFCDELDEDIDEIGELLKKDKKFVESLKGDLKFNNEAVFEGETRDNIGEWI